MPGHRTLAAAGAAVSCAVIAAAMVAGLQLEARTGLAPHPAGAVSGQQPAGSLAFDNFNTYVVSDDPTAATTFGLTTTFVVERIRTYHWNSGRGTLAGVIFIVGSDGRIRGQWPGQGRTGQPGVILGPGVCTIRDSDPATWSHNAASGHAGFAQVSGHPFERKPQAALPPPGGAPGSPAPWPAEQHLR
jgi:hypothetical protein